MTRYKACFVFLFWILSSLKANNLRDLSQLQPPNIDFNSTSEIQRAWLIQIKKIFDQMNEHFSRNLEAEERENFKTQFNSKLEKIFGGGPHQNGPLNETWSNIVRTVEALKLWHQEYKSFQEEIEKSL